MAETFVSVGKTSEIEPGQMKAFEIEGRQIAVANVDGTYYAFDDICTHAMCSLAGGFLEDDTVVCPCHYGSFKVTTGEVVDPPPIEPLQTYPIKTEAGELQIGV